MHCTCPLLTQSGHATRDRAKSDIVRDFLVTVSRDRRFIPFDPDARKVGDFEAAVLNSKWLFQDRIGPILPLQPVRCFGHAHQMRRNFADIDGWKPGSLQPPRPVLLAAIR